jgi:hypothetical protein
MLNLIYFKMKFADVKQIQRKIAPAPAGCPGFSGRLSGLASIFGEAQITW